MAKTLPSAGALISDAWHLFADTWKETLNISIWFLYVGLAELVLALVGSYSHELEIVANVLQLAIVAVAIWTSVRLSRGILRLNDGKHLDMSSEEQNRAWRLVLPLIWVGILTTLAVLGGTLLFILPGIYLGVALSFAQLSLLDQDLRATQALGASHELIKGRWWGTFWRFLAGNFVFAVGIMLVSAVILNIIAAIAGPMHYASLNSPNPDALLQGTVTLFQSIVQALFIPLIICFQVKLYRALQKTK